MSTAGSDPVFTQADGNGLTFGQFVRWMWDQGVEHVKAAAQATVASVRSNVAQAMTGDIGGAASNVVKGVAHGMIQTVKDVGNFGNDFARLLRCQRLRTGRLTVKPVNDRDGRRRRGHGDEDWCGEGQARGKIRECGHEVAPNFGAGVSSDATNVATLPRTQQESREPTKQLGEIGNGRVGKSDSRKGEDAVIINDESRLVSSNGENWANLGQKRCRVRNYRASDGRVFETPRIIEKRKATGEVVRADIRRTTNAVYDDTTPGTSSLLPIILCPHDR